MRILIILSIICSLSACIRGGDIHSNAKPYTSKRLSTPITKSWSNQKNTWQQFNDPNLNRLIGIAYENSLTLEAAKARITRANYIANAAKSTLLPSLDLSGYYQREKFPTYGLIPPPYNGRTFNIAATSLNANYEFDFWGRNKNLIVAAVDEKYAAEAELSQAKLLVGAAVAKTYFEMSGTLLQINLAKENLALNQQILRIAKDRAKHGIQSEIPIKTIENALQNSKLMLDNYLRQEKILTHQLAVLIGNNPFLSEPSIAPFVFHNLPMPLPADIPASLIANRPDIDAAKLRAKAAAARVKVANAAFFPDINLNGFFSYQTIELGKLFNVQSQNNAGMISFDLPIFDAGARRANYGEKFAEYDLAINDYNRTILNALQETADKITEIHSLQSQLKTQYEALNATRQQYYLYLLQYRDGITDYLQTLIIKQLVLQQQAEYKKLQTEYLTAMIGLIKALGGEIKKETPNG